MSVLRMALISTLASGLALTACNRTETEPLSSAPREENGEMTQPAATPAATPVAIPAAIPAGFAEDYRALKNREKDPEKLAAGIRDMLARYGLPSPDRASAPSIPGPVSLPAAEGEPAAGSLGKAAAAAATTKFYVVKDREFHLDVVAYRTMTIPANATLKVTIDHDPATSILDPVAVAFYKPSNAANPNFTKVTIAAMDDDGGGNYNSAFTWLNNTGASRVVTIIGSAYLREVSGVGTLNATCRTSANVSCGSYVRTIRMSGVAVRTNNTPTLPTCTGPFTSSISMGILTGGDNGPGVLAVNAATKRGGFIYGTEGTLALDEVLPAAYPSFVLGFSSGLGGFTCGPTSICFDSPGDYELMQADGYSCQ